MRQIATVDEVLGQNVLISVHRESACSGDCHNCAGCGAAAQSVQVTAENPIGACKGDRVYVESSTAAVLWAEVLVYLMPIACFFLAYWLGTVFGKLVLFTNLALVLSVLPAVYYNRRLKKQPLRYTLIGFVK